MAKKLVKNPNDFESVIVNGCLIEPNTIYEIVPKEPSGNTPEEYFQLGSTKERHPFVSNTCSLSQINTGFYAASELFNREDKIKNNWQARAEKAELLYDIFAEPLRMYIADIEKIKTPTEDEFFDKNYAKKAFSVTIGEGVQFNTANPIQRFQLYIAIVEGEVCMKGKRDDDEKKLGLKSENDPYHQEAQYSYVSITKRKTKSQQNAEIEMECTYQFGHLLRTDKELLIGMLQYIGLPVTKKSTDGELTNSYKTFVDKTPEKIKIFYNTIEKYQKDVESFRQELEILDRLKTKIGRSIIKKEGNTYYMGDVPLGSNAKSIASKLIKEPELLQTFLSKTQEI